VPATVTARRIRASAALRWLVPWLALTGAWLCAQRACAQTQTAEVGAGLGSGIMRGSRGGLAAARASPIFLEASSRFFVDEERAVMFGGSIRMELEHSAGLAVVPRVELRHRWSKLELRPGLAIPIFLAPQTMVGPEVSVAARYDLFDRLGLLGMLSSAVFIEGTDVPDNSTLLMFNLLLGVELEI
jgi:hypothetical protein